MFTYKDNSTMTREELLTEIITEQVKGNKTYTLEKTLRLKDKIPEDKAKDYYAQLGRYIKNEVTKQLETV